MMTHVERITPIIKLKTSILKSSLCDHSDEYILDGGTVTITGARANYVAKRADEREKEVIFKNCALFTHCISEINNAQIHNSKDIDAAMLMYSSIGCSCNY